MCSPWKRKEANRLFWMVKGHLIPKTEPDDIVEGYYESYFKRLWNNTERTEYALDGFEELFKKTLDNPQ